MTQQIDEELGATDTRQRIIEAAIALIEEGGPDAATTRAVAACAGVQPPAIYRMFGDKRGLLDAVVEAVVSNYVSQKAERPIADDPVEDLRTGWDLHVEFGLTHPGLFAIVSGDTRVSSSALLAGEEILLERVERVAAAGRLQVSVPRAVAMLHAAGTGTILTLMKSSADQRDLGLSAAMRESVLATITGGASEARDAGPRAEAASLRLSLGQTDVLSAGERLLLEEILDRIANGGP